MTVVKKIMITGGHVTPALAVIDAIRGKKLPVDIVFVGRKYSNDRENTETFEYNEITGRNIHFIHLKTGRYTRIFSFNSLANLFQIPLGFVRAFMILMNENPDVILSFGGYIALPIAFLAKLLQKKVYTHEQTIAPGLANKRIAAVSDKIFVSFQESEHYFPKDKVIVSGNPIRTGILAHSKQFIDKKNKPCIYVTGGSLGAHAVNILIEKILPELLQKYVVIHQAGNVTEFGDYERLIKLRESLPQILKNNYIIQSHFSDLEIGSVYASSDLVIGRAGANTFFELIALKKPAIFIPLPWSANNEQENQAKIFVENKTGEIFYQNGDSKDLLILIDRVIERIDDYRNNFKSLSKYVHSHAENSIITEIFKT
jgi:UDP-N-acetylglucosamine--N-acetylmuramyl-(pentapeptide) pyrophosphoryl-undecaprenol N-acetylglucosamine transferase